MKFAIHTYPHQGVGYTQLMNCYGLKPTQCVHFDITKPQSMKGYKENEIIRLYAREDYRNWRTEMMESIVDAYLNDWLPKGILRGTKMYSRAKKALLELIILLENFR